MIALCRQFASLDRSQRRLVCEAAAFVALAGAGLRLLPFLTVRRMLDWCVAARLAAGKGPPKDDAVASVRWAIAAVSARFGPATCLVQALAADAMLRRRRLSSELRLGVRAADGRRRSPLEAHAWVECEGAVAAGAIDHLSDMHVLTPASRS